MKIFLKGGKVLTKAGKVAASSKCCCKLPKCKSFNVFQGAPTCGGSAFVGTYGPFNIDCFVTVTGTVDDDLEVNGVIVEQGQHAFHDGAKPPCPGSGYKNGLHSINYTIFLYAGQTVFLTVINNFRGQMFFNGQACAHH